MKLGVAQRGSASTEALPDVEPLSGYRLVRRLGAGAFGEVWAAEGPGGFPAALKIIPRSGDRDDGPLRGLEIARKVRHPNLLGGFGAWSDDRHLVLAMELADGSLWDRFLEAVDEGLPGIPRDELLDALAEAAKGVDYLNTHRHGDGDRDGLGVQHRDLKPRNILLVGGGVKVADFGAARWMEESVTGHTGPNWTPAYAAPEFFLGATSRHSDQYGLAVTYVHLRSGRLPFPGDPALVMAGHLMNPPDLSMLIEAERPAVARALAKRPEDRWPSCRAFIDALRLAGATPAPSLPAPVAAAVEDWPEPDEADVSAWDDEFATSEPSASEMAAVAIDPAAEPDEDESVPAWSTTRPAPTRRRRAILAAAIVATGGLALGMGGLVRPAPGRFLSSWRRPVSNPSPLEGEGRVGGSSPRPRPPIPDERGEIRPELTENETAPPTLPETAPPPPPRRAGDSLATSTGPSPESRALDAATPHPNPPPQGGRGPDSSPDRPSPLAGKVGTGSSPARPDGPDRPDLAATSRPAPLPRGTVPEPVAPHRSPARLVGHRMDTMLARLTLPLIANPTVRGLASGPAAPKAEVVTSKPAVVAPRPDSVPPPAPIRAEPATALEPLPPSASVAKRRGDEHLGRGELDAALADYSEAIRLDPNRPDAHASRGEVFVKKGDFARAIGDLDEAIRLRPSHAPSLNDRGLASLGQGDVFKAISFLDAALRVDPKSAVIHCNRGIIYARLGDATEARAEFDEALRLDPALAVARTARDRLAARSTVAAAPAATPPPPPRSDPGATPTPQVPRRTDFPPSPPSPTGGGLNRRPAGALVGSAMRTIFGQRSRGGPRGGP